MTRYFYSIILILLFSVNLLAKENAVSFIENKHQWQANIKFKADLPFGAMFLTNNEFVYSFYNESDLNKIHELKHEMKNITKEKVNFHSYSVSMLNANKNPTIISNKKKDTYHNYFIGNDKSTWAGHVGLYEQVMYTNIYEGINLSIYSTENAVKYDFIVQPHISPAIIQLKYEGVKPSINAKGDLTYSTSVNKITEQAPYAYQILNGKKVTIPCKYSLHNNILSYTFPKGYNENYELIIDPILIFSSYSGSTANTFGFSATYDTGGHLYAGGECFGVGWPASIGSFQIAYGGAVDAGINKYSPNGTSLIYSTYFGGSSSDLPNNMVVNNNNELIVCGSTESSNLPVTAGCFDNSLGGTADIYIAHFDNTGSALLGSTYIGGSGADGQNYGLSPNYGDQNRGEVYVDANQDIICAVSTASSDFPTTAGCFQSVFGGIQDGCIFKLNPTCTTLLYSTYLGGSNYDGCLAINYNSLNQIIVIGGTVSTDFPTTAGTLHPTNQGGTDGFVTIFDNSLSTMVASTYLGTPSFDHAYKMQIDNADNVYVCGQTSGAYPVTAGLYTNPGSGIFIDKLNPTLTASLSSTVIGQTLVNLIPTAFLYDVCGNVYFSGFQALAGLPVTPNAFQTNAGGFWLCVLENNMTQLLYATYMGAGGDHVDGGTSRFDPNGIIYQSVCTASISQYYMAGAWAPFNVSSSWDVASFKFDFETLGLNAICNLAPNTDSACVPATIPFINNTVNATNYSWDFGDGSPTSNSVSPTHTYMSAGTYTVTLVAFNPISCAISDTAKIVVHVFEMDAPIVSTKDTSYCDANATMLQLTASISNLNNNMTYSWQPNAGVVNGQNTLTPFVNPASSLTYTITVLDSLNSLCKITSQAIVNITFGDTTLFKVNPTDTTVCEGERVTLIAEGGTKYTWQPATNLNDIHTPSINFNVLSPISYSVLIEDNNGCKATRFADVHLFPNTKVNAGENQIIKYNNTTQLAASNAIQYAWNYDISLSNLSINNPTATPTISTNYIVTGTDANGCMSKDTVTIDITNIIIPNAFSPNGDLLNDEIKVVKANNLVDFSNLKIYNRWGKLVFETKDSNKGWDGKLKGVTCEIGTYYYLLTYSIGQKTYTEKGDISLLR